MLALVGGGLKNRIRGFEPGTRRHGFMPCAGSPAHFALSERAQHEHAPFI